MISGLTVQAVAREFQVNANTIRHYLRIGLLTAAKDSSGYHRFQSPDLKVLRFILSARELGFTLEDIQQLLNDAAEGESPCPHARQIIDSRLQEAKAKLASLQALVSRMEKATQVWQTIPNCEPCGEHICHLIEGVNHGH